MRYGLEEVSLLIIDESHRCLKNYAYTFVVRNYKINSKYKQVLGLTASPGTEKKIIEDIAKNLGIETIEIRTRESVDVKPYLKELKFKTIGIEFPEEFKIITAHIRKMYQRKIEELKNRKLLFLPPTKTNILKLQGKIMSQINTGDKNFNVLSGASACAQAIKLAYLIELLETQTLYSANNYIKSMFEQASQNKSKAVKHIINNPEFKKAYILINELLVKKKEHPKIFELKNIVEERIKNNLKHKMIIFSQYRDTVIKIAQELNMIEGINAKVFVGQAKKANTGLSQKEQQEIMEQFKRGDINVITATSIAEEGLDIPEVNAVIFYEPIPSAIRKIQRAGRTARLMNGELIILMTLDTLDEIFYYAARSKEKKMYQAIDAIKKDIAEGKSFLQEEKTENKQKTLF